MQWKPVPGYEQDYEVSSTGMFRRSTLGSRFVGRLIKPYCRKDGYLLIGLYRDGKQTTLYAHRLVCEAFHGSPSIGDYEVAHDNGVPGDNRAENLLWKTPTGNHADKRRHGTLLLGESSGRHRIKSSDVVMVFRLRADGYTERAIGSVVGIHHSHVSDILKRHVWKSVDIPVELLHVVSNGPARCTRGLNDA